MLAEKRRSPGRHLKLKESAMHPKNVEFRRAAQEHLDRYFDKFRFAKAGG